MAGRSPHEVTQLLQAWRHGDRSALDRLVPLVYEELHRLAQLYLRREQAGHILQTTALVNEAYLRLIDANKVQWQDRAHFFAVSAKLMRQILVHIARSMGTQKRGGRLRRETLDEAAMISPAPDEDFVALDEALDSLATFDSRKARVVELRYFGGMTTEETAEALGVSSDTVLREWKSAKLWLWRKMNHRTAG